MAHPLCLPRAHAPCWPTCPAPCTSPATHQGHARHDTRIERESAPLQPTPPWAVQRSAPLSRIRRPASCPSSAARSSGCARRRTLPEASAATRRRACSARQDAFCAPGARQSRPHGRSFRGLAGRHGGRAAGGHAARAERGAKRWGAWKKLAGGPAKARGSARFCGGETALSACTASQRGHHPGALVFFFFVRWAIPPPARTAKAPARAARPTGARSEGTTSPAVG